MRKKVMLVFGTRPEAIKMAPLCKELEKYPNQFEPIICITGQHREMLDQVLRSFEIVPDYDLNIMKPRQDLYDVTSRVLLGMRNVLKEAKPDLIFVHGDTTTSTASALAAFYQQIPVAHIEAGLRTHNIYTPWPEEMNRQITGRIATYHFAPTSLSQQNLLKEGVKEDQIIITGNTVIDTLYMIVDKLRSDICFSKNVENEIIRKGLKDGVLYNNKRKILITAHRRENFGDGFIQICQAIRDMGEKYPEVDFIYPMHPNPNVRQSIKQIFGDVRILTGNIHFIEPLDYLPFVYLMEKSYFVLTDSGGIQEEAPSLGKPVLVMRNITERPEALMAGTVELVGTNYNLIKSRISRLLDDQNYYKTMSMAVNPYGDGFACQRVVNKLLNEFFFSTKTQI